MQIDVINGLLGAGKTTFLLNLLDQMTGEEKVAVLVNEFGEIGIDGDLLSGQGADVVELPNGCICCSLTADLRQQIKTIAETYHPHRLIIEPTGVATIKNLMSILRSLSLEKYIDDIRVMMVIDASMIFEILNQNRGFVESQLEKAQVIIINKCDKVSSDEVEKIKEFIKHVNGTGQILLASFGRVLDNNISDRKACAEGATCGETVLNEHEHEHEHVHEHEHEHEHHHEHEQPLKKYEQFSRTSGGTFDSARLRNFFEQINNERFGPVDRAKGIFRLSDKWVRIDLASREISEVVLDRSFKSSKVMVIGTKLKKESLKEEFNSCLI